MFNFILVFLFPLLSHADLLESQFLKRIAHVDTVIEAEKMAEAYEQARISRTACQIQLREHSAPLACYEVFDKAKFPHLDSLCAEAARKLRVPLHVEGHSISAKCAKNIQAAAQIQSYRQKENLNWSEN